MTPAELIEKALRDQMRVCAGVPMSGSEAEDAARIALDALAGAGLVVVPAEDLRAYLDRGSDLKREVEAMNRLRAALPERTPDA